MKLAEQYELNEQYEEAYLEYKKELLHNSADIEMYTKLAHLALILEKKEDAKVYYTKILEIDPTSILAYEQLIDLYINEDKFKYYFLRGNMHGLQQMLSHAKNDYKKAIDNAKDNTEALPARYLLAGICEEQEKFQEAIDNYLRIADDDENNHTVFLKLAELYEKTEGIVSAILILERAVNENGYKEFEEILAGYYIRNSQPKEALKITKNDLTKARALMDLANNDEAFSILENCKNNNKDNPLLYSLYAQYYYQKDMHTEAFIEIEKYEKLMPNSPLIYQMRALVYEKMNDSFNEHLNWAKYNMVKGNKDVALNEYLIAYQFNDSDTDLIETIASLLESLNDFTKACEFYEILLNIEPNNKNALQKLAIFRDSIGDYTAAFNYLEKLKEISPREQFVIDNYDSYKNRAENGAGLSGFFKSIFGKRMG